MSVLDQVTSLATPTGILVYSGPPHTDDWYETRQAGITATDCVKIVCPSKWGDALSVWADKRGDWDDQQSEAAYWGTVNEPNVADRWAYLNRTNLSPIGILANIDRPHHRASLDRIVHVCPDGDGPCGLQVKTRSAFKAGAWRHDIPDDVWVQEQWEMHVSGYRHMHVAVLFGGNTLKSLRVDRDDDDIAVLVKEADRVWAGVQAGEPPYVDASEDHLGILQHLYPDRDGQATVTEEQARSLIANWLDAKTTQRAADATARRAKAAAKTAEAAMVAALGAAEAAYVDGHPEPAFTYRPVVRPVEARIDRWWEINVPASWKETTP